MKTNLTLSEKFEIVQALQNTFSEFFQICMIDDRSGRWLSIVPHCDELSAAESESLLECILQENFDEYTIQRVIKSGNAYII